MTNTKSLIWRLKEQPTSESLRELVKDNILTKDEAREILFSLEIKEERDVESFKSEIKFLRELVEKLSNQNNSKVVEIIREIDIPHWRKYPWWEPYWTWTTTYDGNTLSQASSNANYSFQGATNFTDIKTF